MSGFEPKELPWQAGALPRKKIYYSFGSAAQIFKKLGRVNG
jgi:hypothetical protein